MIPFGHHQPSVFIRARDTETGEERHMILARIQLLPFKEMAEFVRSHYRRLELIEVREYDPKTDDKKLRKPVPAKYVMFDLPKQIAAPDARHPSILSQYRPIIGRKTIL